MYRIVIIFMGTEGGLELHVPPSPSTDEMLSLLRKEISSPVSMIRTLEIDRPGCTVESLRHAPPSPIQQEQP